MDQMKLFFSVCVFILMLLCVAAVSASQIIIENDGSDHYIAMSKDNPSPVAGYKLYLNYTSGTLVTEISPVAPYIGIANIKNSEGYAIIVGATGQTTSSNRLAKLVFTGEENFTIHVAKLVDIEHNSIPVENGMISSMVVTPPSSNITEYNYQTHETVIEDNLINTIIIPQNTLQIITTTTPVTGQYTNSPINNPATVSQIENIPKKSTLLTQENSGSMIAQSNNQLSNSTTLQMTSIQKSPLNLNLFIILMGLCTLIVINNRRVERRKEVGKL
ncbi:MAG: hypothetical protein PHF57_03490 [Methanoregula sp.]|nr:hypothetical protein [Methanoregula sp.]